MLRGVVNQRLFVAVTSNGSGEQPFFLSRLKGRRIGVVALVGCRIRFQRSVLHGQVNVTIIHRQVVDGLCQILVALRGKNRPVVICVFLTIYIIRIEVSGVDTVHELLVLPSHTILLVDSIYISSGRHHLLQRYVDGVGNNIHVASIFTLDDTGSHSTVSQVCEGFTFVGELHILHLGGVNMRSQCSLVFVVVCNIDLSTLGSTFVRHSNSGGGEVSTFLQCAADGQQFGLHRLVASELQVAGNGGHALVSTYEYAEGLVQHLRAIVADGEYAELHLVTRLILLGDGHLQGSLVSTMVHGNHLAEVACILIAGPCAELVIVIGVCAVAYYIEVLVVLHFISSEAHLELLTVVHSVGRLSFSRFNLREFLTICLRSSLHRHVVEARRSSVCFSIECYIVGRHYVAVGSSISVVHTNGIEDALGGSSICGYSLLGIV